MVARTYQIVDLLQYIFVCNMLGKARFFFESVSLSRTGMYVAQSTLHS